ncbi:response regulator transcription factor [Paenibacillus sp. IITD108]|uniref:response regulator transcription factor n=1 Tax=Paenibacillus sp. IITD108 TaxID=3116649 RepID=UPI002F3F0E45
MKLLIADDEQYVRDSLTTDIDWNKYGIHLEGVAIDGREAFEMALRLRPDVLLTDIRMPYMDGLELIKQLKMELPQLKAILLTGWSDFEYARKGLQLGVANYLIKPSPDEEIIDALLVVAEELGFRKSEKKQTELTEQGQLKSKKRTIKLACEYVHKDLSIAVTLTETAEAVNMNPSAFSRLFKQEMGCSFSEFVTSARMNKAKKLLVDSYLRINEISQQVGYMSDSHFVQVFGDFTGMTPGKFREING